MEALIKSYNAKKDFPVNLEISGAHKDQLKQYRKRLQDHRCRLFGDPKDANVDLLQLDAGKQAFVPLKVENEDSIGVRLRMIRRGKEEQDPLCRFIFFTAPSSRDALYTTFEMFTAALSCHQVMPDFLDFVFPFGESEHAQDFHFSGFRAENQFSKNPGAERGLAVPALGRSGRQFQMCFNLRSVEMKTFDSRRPWSIRQIAAYHSFDVETGRTVWIFVKGNSLMRDRVESALTNRSKTENNDIGSFSTVTAAFASSLNVHIMICEWSRENWRWYINFLEERFQGLTRHSLLATVDTEIRPTAEITAAATRSHTTPLPTIKRQGTIASIGRAQLTKLKKAFTSTPSSSTRAADVNRVPLQTVSLASVSNLSDEKEFSFEKLQSVQNLEEKATETLLVLKTNMDVLNELKDCYARFQKSESWPDELKGQARDRLVRFETRVSSVVREIGMEKSRLETLVRHISDRKTLLTGILDYQNVKLNMEIAQKAQFSAEKAQMSADNMEKMTAHMQGIASKTEQETVSMKVVTYVTLFFLPGTFVSTLMSTDIIKYSLDNNGALTRQFSFGCLKIYLYITLPMMATTFFASWLFRLYENRVFRRRDKELACVC